MDQNFIINFSGTRIAKLAKINRFFSGFFGKFISFVCWIFGIIVLVIWGSWILNPENINSTFGLDQILLSIFFVFLSLRGFLRYFVENPQIIEPKKSKEIIDSGNKNINIFNTFSISLAKVFISFGSKINEVSTSKILKSIAELPESSFIFARLGISNIDFAKSLDIEKTAPASNLNIILAKALEIAIIENHKQIEVGDMIVALSEADLGLSALLSKLNLTSADLSNIVYWETGIRNQIEKNKKFLDPENLHLTGGVGRDWSFGYTPDLFHFASDLTKSVENQGLGLEIIGHDKEISLLEETLNRSTGANAILVGEPGVGKKTTVLGLAKNLNEGKTLPNLAHKHIMQLDVDLLIAGLSGPGEFTERITQVFSQAANAGNVIIFIDGIEKIMTSGETGKVDATPVLIPYLSYPEINFIGTTNISEYNNIVASNPSLLQRFEKIEITEPNDEEMIRILEDVAPKIENHFQVLITYPAIKEVIKLAKKYVLDQPNPEKSISLLEGAANSLNSTRNKVVDAEIIDNYVGAKTNIPVKEATGRERDILVTLEEKLHQKVVSQDQAIKAVAGALRRSRAGAGEDSKKPIGSFLFLGPTGVGKTETAKALASIYFGSTDAMTRFDMGEYQNKEDVYRLIGSTASGNGERTEGELISAVRNKPFSLILFDEIEKANPDILNLLLSVLDEGFITSSAGRKVYFKNTIIIATSNAGANLVRQLTAKNTPYEAAQKTIVEYIQNQGIFKPEFLNRFSSIIYYKPLSQEEIKQVAKILITNLAKEVFANKGIKLKLEFAAVDKLAQLGYDPEMGARPMMRVIEEQVENFIAEKLLKGEVKKGDEIIFRVGDIK